MDQNQNPNPDSSSDMPANPEPQSEENVSMNSDPSMSSDPQVVAPQSSETNQAEAMTTPSAQMSEPVVQTMPQQAMVSTDPAKKTGRSGLWKKVAIICAVLLVLGGGSAAAFYTVYLPSQPWYVLDTALKNTMAQNNISANTTLNLSSIGSNGLAIKLASLTAANFTNKQVDENLNITVAGATIPVELRLVNSNLYFKFGDLSSVASLASLAAGSLNDPNLSKVVTPLLASLSNQWVVVDSTLLDQSKALKCLLNSNWNLSSSDSNYMVNTYLSQPFLSVKSTSSDTINGASEDKMSVSMNDNQAAKYIQSLSNLEASKSYDQCAGTKATIPSGKSSLADGQTTPFTFWINKSTNRIDKLESVSTAQDAKKGISGNIDMTFSYASVNVQAPTNAIPVVQLISHLTQSLQNDPQLLNTVGPLLSGL